MKKIADITIQIQKSLIELADSWTQSQQMSPTHTALYIASRSDLPLSTTNHKWTLINNSERLKLLLLTRCTQVVIVA